MLFQHTYIREYLQIIVYRPMKYDPFIVLIADFFSSDRSNGFRFPVASSACAAQGEELWYKQVELVGGEGS